MATRRKTPKVPRTPSEIRRSLERQSLTSDDTARALVGSIVLLAERLESYALALEAEAFKREQEPDRHGCMSCGVVLSHGNPGGLATRLGNICARCIRETRGRFASVGSQDWADHRWLCHGSARDGSGGEFCPDGCQTLPDPERMELYGDGED